MFGKDKFKMPETIDELKAMFPDMTKELMEQGAKSVDVEGKVKEAVSAEIGRALGLVNAELGDEAGEKFKKVYETGVTGDQYKTIKAANPPAPAVKTAEDLKKDEMLAAIIKAGAQNPGAGENQSGGTLSGEDKYKAEYARSKDLQDEFKAESTYVAFKKAEAEGKVRILKPKG